MTRPERGLVERGIRWLYLRGIVSLIDDRLLLQRLKLPWYGFGYWRLLMARGLQFSQRLRLLRGFLRVDWNVVHGHWPREISYLVLELARPSRKRSGKSVVEAGCWRGGSSAKLSLVCGMSGCELHIYDSFQGVEEVSTWKSIREWEYGGQYVASQDLVERNLREYGDPSVCEIHEGWFSDTMADTPVPGEVVLAFIDCDLAKATEEALSGIVPSLVSGGVVFSQDFHIEPVRRLLRSDALWERLGVPRPSVRRLDRCLARIGWDGGSTPP